MSNHLIKGEDYEFNLILLMDSFVIREIAKNTDAEFKKQLGTALKGNPVVLWYCIHKCPETAAYFEELANNTIETDDVRHSEIYILNELDWAVVNLFPEGMEKLPYIKAWNKERLLSMTDFRNKIVLDLSSGTGRLAFATCKEAKFVYASEPVERLRIYLKEKQRKLNVKNMSIVCGTEDNIPFFDNSFDIVMTGRTKSEDYEKECKEMCRVLKPGGFIIRCPGEDDHIQPEPDKELLRLGFAYSHYISANGGDVYRYKKQITK